VTPFDEQENIDESAFTALLEQYQDDGVDGVIVAGSTGEWYTLRDDERIRLFELARGCVRPPTKLIAGTSAIATRDAVSLTLTARDIGCDGAMVMAPPYAQPNETELCGHFDALSGARLPLMLYNNPGRTQVNLTVPVLEKLCQLENVVALKDSTKDLYQIAATIRAVSDQISVFSGLEPYALPALQRGAAGIVSMAANVLGERAVDLYRHALAGRWAEAREIEAAIDQLYDAFYAGGYGAYVVIKECMRLVGRPAGWPRRPHLRVDRQGRHHLAKVLTEIGALGSNLDTPAA
jgi:4-hydroxy-tetrahydrodipicolinate synthase